MKLDQIIKYEKDFLEKSYTNAVDTIPMKIERISGH